MRSGAVMVKVAFPTVYRLYQWPGRAMCRILKGDARKHQRTQKTLTSDLVNLGSMHSTSAEV